LSKPEPRYFATAAGGQILPLVPLDQPHLSANDVANYAVRAVTDALTYDFKNYRADFQGAQDYFTKPDGWNSFVEALEKSDQLTMVKDRRLNTTAVAQDAVIVREGVNGNGVYEWVIQIPVRMTYESASEISGQDLLVTVTMQRLQTYQSPYAAAISRFVAARGGRPSS
jgi:intracellular multiplication protein IcmL